MGFVGIVKLVLQYAPVAIDTVERIIGGGKGADKRVAAAKEVIELISEGLGVDYGWEDVDFANVDYFQAVKDEKEFIEKVATLNDAAVALVNYVSKFKKEVPQ